MKDVKPHPQATLGLAPAAVVISGGGSGVGAAMAMVFANHGHQVTICGRRLEPLQVTAAQHPNIDYCVADVSQIEPVKALWQQMAERQRTPLIVVANAGASDSAPFDRTSEHEFLAAWQTHVMGTVNLWQASLPAMRRAHWGRLIAVASTASLKGYRFVAPYVAAKHAVLGLTRSVALEVARQGITANALCPGFIDTPMLEISVQRITAHTQLTPQQARDQLAAHNPQRRLITPDEVAQAALWLASEQASACNGSALNLSGGEV